jgi:ATP-dependent DNA helicase RecQ
MVKVLAGWDWAQRPAGVVTLPSRTRPELTGSLAARIAEIGRLPHLGELGYRPGAGGVAGRPAPRQYNSAQRLAAVWRELTVPEPVRAAVAGLGGPVLLVDDRVDTGWTMTVAALLLREAGAAAVLPLVLAVGN